MSVSRPNILFFFADDQRFDTIHAVGCEEIRTPNLDRLVGEGTVFTNGAIMGGTCGAVCMPSRAMLMTSKTLFHLEGHGSTIPEDHALMPEVLRQQGYATFGTGKWHNGARAYARCFSHGAEIFFGGMDDHWNVPACDFHPDGDYPEPREITRPMDTWYDDEGNVSKRVVTNKLHFDHIRDGAHSTDLFADATVEFLKAHAAGQTTAQPFFAYVSFMAPHDPRETHEQYHGMYDADAITLPPSFMAAHPFDNGEMDVRDEMLAPRPRTPQNTREQIADYYAMITHVDDAVGRVLKTLEETGEYENTIIVFAGDNGLAVGRHGLFGKQSLYDHSVRVPLLLAGPGIPRGERREALAYVLDLFPTLCDLADVDVPEGAEGRSLVHSLNNAADPVRDTLYFAYRDLHRGVRDRRFKLIEYVVDGARTTQLFDLQADPWELNDLSADPTHTDDIARLRADLIHWRHELDDDGPFWDGYESGA